MRGSLVSAEQGSEEIGKYVEEVGPHYASGSYVLLEADVDFDRLRSAAGVGGPSEWSEGPISLVKRASKTRGIQVIDGEKRSSYLGPELRRLVHGKGRRFHRYVRHTIRSLKREGAGADRAIVVTGFEILRTDTNPVRASRGSSSFESGENMGNMAPAIVIVHLDLTVAAGDVVTGHAAIRAEALANTLRRLMRDYQRQFCALIGNLLSSRESTTECAFNTDSKRFEFLDDGGSLGNSSTMVSVLGAGSAGTSALVPIYSFLTVATGSVEDALRSLESDRKSSKNDKYHEVATEGYSADVLRAARAFAFATLDRDFWLDCSVPEDLPGRSNPPLPWRGWHVEFSRQGAGVAAMPGESLSPWDGVDHRAEVSGFYADLLALELLKGRILKDFSDRLHRTAEDLLLEKGQHETALSIWQEFALFTTDYASGVPVLNSRSERFLEAFRSALGIDVDAAIERTQANLDRLAQIARMQQDEKRRRQDQIDREELREQTERQRGDREAEARHEREVQGARAKFDRHFAIFIGAIATLFLPSTVIPPILEWFYVNPDSATVGVRALWTILGMVLFAIVFGLIWREMRAERDREEEKADSRLKEYRKGALHR